MKTKNLGAVTAYADAVKQGYKGTREEFGEVMANFADSAAQVAADAQEIRETKENIEGMESNVQALQEQAAESAQASEQSKIEAAGYADAAEVSRQAAAESEANVNARATGFEEQVTVKTEEAESDITTAKETAVAAITKQQTDSIQAIKDQSATEQEKLETYSNQAKTAAENAAQSEQAAKTAKEAAESAKTATETAKTQAEQAATKTAEDRTAVEAARETVTQTAREVGENKEAVENTAQNFNLVYQQAVKDVNDAGQAQTERVQEAGNSVLNDIGTFKANALSAINAAGETQTKAVNDAGAAQTKAVNDAGTTQISAITKEGEMQVSNVQEAATEIIADREQIEINRQNLLKTAIKRSASGKTITLSDSAEMPLARMKQYGWTKQETTTGAQLLNLPDRDQYIGSGVNVSIQNGIVNCDTVNTGGPISLVGGYSNTNPIFTLSKGTYTSNVTLRNYDGTTKLNYSGIFTLDKDTEITDVAIATGNAKVGNNYPMLNAGTELFPWEPYTGGIPSPNPDYPQELVSAGDKGSIETVVTGKNLLDQEKEITVTSQTDIYAIVRTSLPVDVFTVSADLVNNTAISVTLRVDASKDGSIVSSQAENLEGNMSKRISVTMDLSETEYDTVFIRLLGSASGYSVMAKHWQIEEGTEGSAYEPPIASQSLIHTAPNGLPGLPVTSGGNYTDENGQQWIADYRDWERGVDVKRIGTVKDKISNLNIVRSDKNLFSMTADNFKLKTKILCNVLKNGNTVKDNHTISSARGDALRAYFRIEEADSLEDLKNIYGEIEMILHYELATPIETPIPPEELAAYHALHTNHPNTTICNDEDVWMEVEYGIDTEASIDAKVQESNIMTDAATRKKYVLGMKDGLLTVYEVIE